MNPYILLAKQAMENYVEKGEIIALPEDLPKEFLKRKSGTFVTIMKKVRGLPRSEPKVLLRGCIGTYLPTKENIAKEIIDNAIAAATEDYRFGPIEKEELPHLSYTVYILNPPELVKDLGDPTKFSEEKFRRAGLNPKKFGIIIKTVPITNKTDVMFNGHMPAKSGLLLPDLPGIDSIEKQFLIACQKGGIDPAREKILIYRFTVEKHV